jgi:hypothetical protein
MREWPAAARGAGEPEPGHVVIDLTGIDAWPGARRRARAGDRARDGAEGPGPGEALARSRPGC